MKDLKEIIEKIAFKKLHEIVVNAEGPVWVYRDGSIVIETPNTIPPGDVVLVLTEVNVDDVDEFFLDWKEYVIQKIEQQND